MKRVELDLKQMMDINGKLARVEKVDTQVVSNLLLSGVINVIEQHDHIEELEEQIKLLEHSDTTSKMRLESLENWVLRQGDSIINLDEKLSILDVNGAIIEESKEIKEMNKKIVELDLKVNQVRVPSGKENLVSKDKPSCRSTKCKDCNIEFIRNCDLEKHL